MVQMTLYSGVISKSYILYFLKKGPVTVEARGNTMFFSFEGGGGGEKLACREKNNSDFRENFIVSSFLAYTPRQ
jgi:hypothetical protein